MFWLIIGLLLKLAGIVLAIPNTLRSYKHWKDKETAKLWEANSAFRRRGVKPKIPKWKRTVFFIVKMPNPHLWKFDKTEDFHCPRRYL